MVIIPKNILKGCTTFDFCIIILALVANKSKNIITEYTCIVKLSAHPRNCCSVAGM